MSTSLNKNIFLTVIKTVASLAFPLITYPYICRVLSPKGVGEFNYAQSIVSYFILLASLGVGTYAIREGAKIRDKKERYNIFASEIFSLNLFTTLLAYVVLFLCFGLFEEFRIHYKAILVFSIQILFETIGVNWIFATFEDYLYITIRTISFQLLSLVMLFVFVHEETDLYIYICIYVLSTVGANIFNIIYSRIYFRFIPVKFKSIWKHFAPIFVIFSTILATVIYVNTDVIMLGWMKGTEQVGYYAVATKVYAVIKGTLNAIVPVFLARLSFEFENDKKMYLSELNYVFDLLTLFTVPIAVGALFFSDITIIILSGEKYLTAKHSLQILLLSNFFATCGNILCSGVLLQMRQEKKMLWATTTGALINIAANIYMIPKYGCSGAALTTLLTEVIVLSILGFYTWSIIKQLDYMHLIKCMMATFPIIAIELIRKNIGYNGYSSQLISVILCACSYFIMLFILRDRIVLNCLKILNKRVRKIYG